MSQSFSEPTDSDHDTADRGDTAEPDVEKNDDQVEPDNDSEYVGRVAGDDLGYAGEQGSEARANGADADDA